jgi:superfamily I DNA and/or RNA helicase
MERLVGFFQHPLVQLLDTQYRMNNTIMSWSSKTFYKSRLNAADTVSNKRLGDLKGVKVEGTAPAILLVTTGGRMGEQSSRDVAKSSLANPGEAEIIVRAVRGLVARGVRAGDIGIISFYALQVDLIR